jgi:hypothetical protein
MDVRLPAERELVPLYGFDSTEPAAIPADAAVIFPYGDGLYAWTAAEVERFPRARRRYITVTGDPACNIFDVEHGDGTPADAPDFLQEWRDEHGGPGCIYCNRSTLPAVQRHCHAAGLAHDSWRLFLSTLDGTLIRPGAIRGGGVFVAVQLDTITSPRGAYDRSRVWARSWPRRQPR